MHNALLSNIFASSQWLTLFGTSEAARGGRFGCCTNIWTDHNRRTIRTERLKATAIGLAWVLAGMLAMTLLLAIARYALARAADAATLAPSMMMF